MKLSALVIALSVLLAGCTSVEGVMEAKGVYCSGFYKGIRAVGRGALSATTGVVVPDVCDQIDDIVEAEASEDSDGGANGNNSGDN